MVPVIKPTRMGSGSVRWQPTTDDWAEPRKPQRASLSVHDLITADDLITAVKQTVSEMTAASTNADTPNLAHVLTCRERWVGDASSVGLQLHAVRRLLEPMLLHLFKQIEAKQAAYGEGGSSAPLSSPLRLQRRCTIGLSRIRSTSLLALCSRRQSSGMRAAMALMSHATSARWPSRALSCLRHGSYPHRRVTYPASGSSWSSCLRPSRLLRRRTRVAMILPWAAQTGTDAGSSSIV